MTGTIFVAPDYLLANSRLVGRLRAVFTQVVGPTHRDRAVAELAELGDEVTAAIVGLTESIDRALLERLPNLRVVGFMGVGTDRIDTKALDERNIGLVTAKGANSNAVAEHALALILASLKNLPQAFRANELGIGRFDLSRRPRDLQGRTVGTVGAGDSAVRLHRILSGFSCRQLYWTQHPSPSREIAFLDVERVPLELLFRECDVVSLHIPLNEATHSLITPRHIETMPTGAVLVNVARGGLLDSDVIVTAIAKRNDLVYAVDDPPPANLKSIGYRLISTPHSAGITEEGLIAMQERVVNEILTGRPILTGDGDGGHKL